jgi:hypothetical protein
MNQKSNIVLFFVIILAVFSRLFITIPNFTVIGSLALFCGAILSQNKKSILIPFLALLAGDLILALSGKLYTDYFMDGYFVYVYVAFGLIWFIGKAISTKVKFKNILLASLISSVSFFLITNFGSWLQIPYYSKDLFGLGQSYLAGLAFYNQELTSNFFLNQLVGDLFFAALFFGLYSLVNKKSSNDLIPIKVKSK